jgi:ribosomal-protein-alanine N-acetyltransferase
MGGPPTIQTRRLLLRAFTMDDAPDVARLAAEREIAANTATIPHPYTLEDARAWLLRQGEQTDGRSTANWAITDSGRLVGCVGLILEPAHDRAEIGYWIGTPFWGRGFATEAAAAVLHHGFTAMGLHRIFAQHYARNPASGRVLAKIGLRMEGTARGHVKKWGVYEDCVGFGLTRDEYDARR